MSLWTKILAALLVLQVGALAARGGLGHKEGAGSHSAEGVPILPEVHAGDVTRVEITAEARGAEKPEAVVLSKGAAGWVVESAFGYPAREKAAETLIEKLVGAKSVAVVATQKKSHAALEVADGKAQRDVRLVGAGGHEVAHLLFGKAASGGAFVRRAEKDEVLRSDGALTWEIATSPSAFMDTQLTSFDMGQVRSFTIERRAATCTALERGDDDGWRYKTAPAGGDVAAAPSATALPASKEKVEDVMRAASHCWFQKVAAAKPAPEHGLEPAECLLSFKLKDGGEVKLALGKRAADGHNVYARKVGSDFVVEVSEGTLNALEKEPEFFKPAPPPAAPGAGAVAPGGGAPGMPGGMQIGPGGK